MKTITVARIGSHPTVRFAADELSRYLKMMDSEAMVEQVIYDAYDEKKAGVLFVGTDPVFEPLFPAVKDRALDDIIHIGVTDFCGVITGGNVRSVLLAVYRFLKELGAAWVRPGIDGELIPQRKLDSCFVSLTETPSYRHRGICIEGAVGYEHVNNIIDWLPKAGMNCYFIQFSLPHDFFDRFYSHTGNPTLKKIPFTRKDSEWILAKVEEDISLRSLMYHAVGHGWTCDPLGIGSGGWSEVKDDDIPEDKRKLLAMINGKRGLWEGKPLNTELCFSNPKVTDLVAGAVVDYCVKHQNVTHLHIWLADCGNNHCECPDCQKQKPSDWYVDLLNEVDRRLTKRGISQHIVFLVYLDLLWAPTKKIVNQERFVLMFAPSTRVYSDSFMETDFSENCTVYPYERNHCRYPKNVTELVSMVRLWQEQMPDCDSFDFDYYLWTVHLCDIGYYGVSSVLFRDMQSLDRLKMNGMVNCQLQRAAFPTNLPLEALSAALWDKTADFNTVADRYFQNAFGAKYGAQAKDYLKQLSDLTAPGYSLGSKKLAEVTDEQRVEWLNKALGLIADFRAVITAAQGFPLPAAQHQSWVYLSYHSDFAEKYCRLLCDLRAGKQEETLVADRQAVSDWLNENEPAVHRVFDICRMQDVLDTGYYKRLF